MQVNKIIGRQSNKVAKKQSNKGQNNYLRSEMRKRWDYITWTGPIYW